MALLQSTDPYEMQALTGTLTGSRAGIEPGTYVSRVGGACT